MKPSASLVSRRRSSRRGAMSRLMDGARRPYGVAISMRARWLARCSAVTIVLLGAGCGPRSGSTEAHRPHDTTVSATATSPEVSSTVTISGRIRAHDGSPLKKGEVSVMGGFGQPLTASLDETGAFSLEVPRGVVIVLLAGVDHAPRARRTLLTGPLSIDGTLGTHSTPPTEPDLEIIGQFLDAEGQLVGPAPRSAARVRDGVHQLDLSERPAAATSLRYQLRSPGGRPFNGPVADRYTYDGRGNFSSVVDLDDRAALQLDLATMPPAERPAELRWSGEDDATIAILEFKSRWGKKLRELEGASPRGGPGSESTPESASVVALQAEARAEVDAVTDPTLRGLLRGALVTVFATEDGDAPDPATVHAEAAWFVEHVTPDDIHIGLIGGIDSILLASLESDPDAERGARTWAWLERRVTDNPDVDVALGALGMLLALADEGHDDARVAELFAQLEHPRFEGCPARQVLTWTYDPNRVLKRGKTLPAFEYAALAADAEPVDSEGRAGHLYLLEFWATWCEPCVEDMPNLHAAYAAVNGAKPAAGDDRAPRTLLAVADPVVEFVFVSLDANPDDVVAFRDEHWSMPWTHAHVEQDQHVSLMEALGFSKLPTSVLVDEEGTILALGDALHGERLLPTLQGVLAEREAP